MKRTLLERIQQIDIDPNYCMRMSEISVPIKSRPLYYRVVVIRAPLQGLCYNVRDAVDWFSRPTARRFQKGSNHSPLQYC